MNRTKQGTTVFAVALSFFVFGCSSGAPRYTATIDEAASLTGNLPANPLQWRVITSSVNPADSTMTTLYGNDIAINNARANIQHEYSKGAVLSLVTWAQQEDPRYFGARVPGQVRSVEFVSVEAATDGKPSYAYLKYEGTPLKPSPNPADAEVTVRIASVLSQRPAVLP